MIFKMYEVKNMKEPLTKLIEKEIPVKAAFRLNNLIKEFDIHLTTIEDYRVQLINKYGVKNEETGDIQVPPKKMKDFMKEINGLLNEDVTIEFKPLNINLFGEDLTLTTKDLMILEKIFE